MTKVEEEGNTKSGRSGTTSLGRGHQHRDLNNGKPQAKQKWKQQQVQRPQSTMETERQPQMGESIYQPSVQ
jgi:hypothetical protein